MKLRTKVPVEYYKGIRTVATDIVEGHLINVSLSGDGNELGANFMYTTTPDENGNAEVIAQNGFTIKGVDIDNLYNLVKDDIPTGLSYRETEQYKNYLGFRYEMAQTFGVSLSDIEILS